MTLNKDSSISSFKPYSEYKDTGVPWLVKIPSHWDEMNLWTLCRMRNEKNPGNLPLLSVFLHRGIILHNDSNRQTHAPSLDLSNYQIVKNGDFVLNNQQAWRGSVGVSSFYGIISPAYIVLQLSNLLNTKYANYLVQSSSLVDQFVISSKGVGDIQRQLYWPYLRYVKFCVPPLDEQTAIVRYLDHMDRLIKRYIRAKQKEIKLLNEQKQAVIQQAVTRGLNPDVKLKPSGVEWLGDVPQNWEILKIRQTAKINPSRGNIVKNYQPDDLVTFLPMECVSGQGEIDTSRFRPIHEVWQGFTYFHKGDVIIAKITPCFENGKGACLNNLPTEIGFGTTEFIVLRPGEKISSKFLYLLTSLTPFRRMGVESMTGSAGQQRISHRFVADFIFALPPVEKQDEIINYVEHITTEYNKIIIRTRSAISYLKEYRTRLIADVVTGKLDVREAVSQLPEELAALELEEELLEEEPVEEELGTEPEEGGA